MKWTITLLLVLFVGFQYRLWVGEGSFADVARLTREIRQQQVENDQLRTRNNILAIEVDALKSGLEGVEEHARSGMGMIKKGETFYMVIEDEGL